MSLGGVVLQTSGVVDDGASAVIGRMDWMLNPATTMLKEAKHQQIKCCNISSYTCPDAAPLQSPPFSKYAQEGHSIHLSTIHDFIAQHCRSCKYTGYTILMVSQLCCS